MEYGQGGRDERRETNSHISSVTENRVHISKATMSGVESIELINDLLRLHRIVALRYNSDSVSTVHQKASHQTGENRTIIILRTELITTGLPLTLAKLN